MTRANQVLDHSRFETLLPTEGPRLADVDWVSPRAPLAIGEPVSLRPVGGHEVFLQLAYRS